MGAMNVPTQRGHPEPALQQFTVFLPNRVGKLRELMNLFIRHRTHVVALDVLNAQDWAVVRLILSDAMEARNLLRASGFAYTECAMLAVELPSPDALADLAGALLAAEVSLQVAYPLLVPAHGRPVVALHVDDPTVAEEVLVEQDFTLLDESDLWETGENTGPFEV
ncbi:MAG: acetolactate synthase [Planctomycetota bacterium]